MQLGLKWNYTPKYDKMKFINLIILLTIFKNCKK